MNVRICDEFGSLGFSWMVEETMTRTSHAVLADGRVWVIDPVDDPGVIERIVALGPPVAVLQLLDRHNRDCAAVAARLGVPHVTVPTALPGSPFEVVAIKRRPWWREVAVWWPAERMLIVAEVVGTNRFFRAGRGAAGVHPMVRLFPPRAALARFAPRHLLVGHGVGVHGDAATSALQHALADGRRGIPGFVRTLVRRGQEPDRGRGTTPP